MNDIQLAVDTWEALFRAQATIKRELVKSDVWKGLAGNEYGVLYALSSAPKGLRVSELTEDALLSQAGLSRLVERLETKGMVTREDDPDDRRACRLRLTAQGRRVQRRIGAGHGRHVAQLMTRGLDAGQLTTLRDLCATLLASVSGPEGGKQ
jgi:DNA-binding MarR family transcriptional regulator